MRMHQNSRVDDLFILAGNGPYENRGCEAIVRGTTQIIQTSFGNCSFIVMSNFSNSRETYERQIRAEIAPNILHKKSNFIFGRDRKKNIRWWCEASLKYASSILFSEYVYFDLRPYMAQAKAVLSIGGDNYSLDYGLPHLFLALDNFVLRRKRKIIIWGASIGPFETSSVFKNKIIEHLKRVIIFARESCTLEYLYENGIRENVYRTADPAFILKPQQPSQYINNIDVSKGSIGINLSPLMAKFVTNGDMKSWIKLASETIKYISENIDRKIYLIPHVTVKYSDDYSFLRSILLSLMPEYHKKIDLIPPIYNAAEIKWIIGQMDCFFGCRMHSTIASLSMGVPTLTLGYSFKAKGINQDIFGTLDYYIDCKQYSKEDILRKLKEILEDSQSIRSKLNSTLPIAKQLAMQAGVYLKQIVRVD